MSNKVQSFSAIYRYPLQEHLHILKESSCNQEDGQLLQSLRDPCFYSLPAPKQEKDVISVPSQLH